MASNKIRTYACSKLSALLNVQATDKLCLNLEKCIFNWAVRVIKQNGDQPSWENPFFMMKYKNKFLNIQFNLKDPSNNLKERLTTGKVLVTEVVNMGPVDLNPAGLYATTKEKLRVEDLHKLALNSEDDSYEGMFKCGKCKSKKTSYYQLQTRSADEPMTTFITCKSCGNRWKC
jgi:transcription elongation factor S-II